MKGGQDVCPSWPRTVTTCPWPGGTLPTSDAGAGQGLSRRGGGSTAGGLTCAPPERDDGMLRGPGGRWSLVRPGGHSPGAQQPRALWLGHSQPSFHCVHATWAPPAPLVCPVPMPRGALWQGAGPGWWLDRCEPRGLHLPAGWQGRACCSTLEKRVQSRAGCHTSVQGRRLSPAARSKGQ